MRRRRHSPGDVAVCVASSSLLDDARAAAAAWALLGAAEREANERLRSAAARRDHLAAHALVRLVVADVLAIEAASVVLETVAGAAPRVVAPAPAADFRVSLSHADGFAVCAVADDRAVGVDVESRRNVGPDPLGIAATVCSPREIAALRSISSDHRAEDFLRRWVLKEALAKATGEGLLVSPRDLSDARPTSESAIASSAQWRLVRWSPAPGYEAGLAFDVAAGESVAVRWREWRSDGVRPLERAPHAAGTFLELERRS